MRALSTLCMEQSEEWESGRIYLNMSNEQGADVKEEWIWREQFNLAEA